MASVFNKEIVRSIRGSVGRFAAIAIISLLGAGFYAGLRMAAPDMRIAGDDFFDGCSLYDISVVSTLGLDDQSVAMLEGVQGVGKVMPAYRVDAMVLTSAGSYAACVESLPVDAASASDSSSGATVVSDDDGYLNRPILLEGSWPASPGECVVAARNAEELGLGVGDRIEVQEAAGELEDTFAVTSFDICGLVNSPAYASSGMLGTTSLGTGTLDLYVYVDASAFDGALPYSVAYLSVPAAMGEMWQSVGYEAAVDEVAGRVGAIAADVGDARWEAVRGEAQGELDDARADYESERADAEADLSDAEADLADARRKLDSAAAQLQSSRAQLDQAAAEIAENEAELRAAYAELESGQAELDGQKAAFEGQYAQLGALEQQRGQLAAGIEQARAGAAYLELRLAAAKDEGAPEAQVAAIERQLAEARAQLAELQEQLAALDAGIGALEDGKAQIEAAQAELDAARDKLDAGRAQLERGRAQYYSGVAQYESGLAEYRDGERQYAEGLAEYEDGKAEAEEGFADAEAELADAQADIDGIERPQVFVMDRSKNAGAVQLASDADGIQQIATFLPFMFFLVAALVSLTSMTRMVDEERLEIGTHKALGYGKARITSKYLTYGVLASGIGSVVGVVFLGKLLPWFILTSYQVTYAVPTAPLPLEPFVTAKAIGLSVGVTALATWGAAAASLRERPASLMLPRAPKAGKRIFLEHIGPLWRRMSFSQKVTARNLLRYKRRFFMAVVGIAGCTALLMIGFGLRDAIGGIVSNQYEVLVRYDAAVRIDGDATDRERAQVDALLASGDVEDVLAVGDFNMIAQGDGDDMRVEVVVPSDDAALPGFVLLRDRETGEAVGLEPDGVVLTEKAAATLGVEAGDTVELFDENQVGDKEGDGRRFTVAGVAENYLGHFAYMLPETYRAAFGEDADCDLLYVRFAPGADASAAGADLLALDAVSTVGFVSERITSYEDMLDVMNKLIYVIMLLSAALAFVVLYNLTNINITERVREIATLKVLGFTRGETNAYIFREVIVMALAGALVGCVIGAPLTFYIAQAAETPQMMFGRAIEPASFVLSFVITMIFTVIVAFTMRGKLARVNMVESLKSVE